VLAVVTGAGLAGSIVSLVLARCGWRIAIVEKRSISPNKLAPEHVHAHVFRDEDISWVCRLLKSARTDGDSEAKASTRAGSSETLSSSYITRRDVDGSLTAALRDCPAIVTRYRTRLERADWDGNVWRVFLDSGEEFRADLVLDASGRALAAAKKTIANKQRKILVEEIPDKYRYRSWFLSRTSDTIGVKAKTVILDNAARIHLFPDGASLATLTWIGSSAPPKSWRELCEFIAVADMNLASTLMDAEVVEKPISYSASALARAATDMLPDRVLLIGDSLIQTPPRYGNGLQHICAQAQILESYLSEKRNGFSGCRTELSTYAEYVWNGVALTIGLEAGLTPATGFEAGSRSA